MYFTPPTPTTSIPYTWDVFRNIYQGLIPVTQRKAFDEYYNPDWQARMLAKRILNDSCTERAVVCYLRRDDAPAGTGILDTGLRSGTFLYHAALRILNSDALKQAAATPTEQADFIAKMVNGIDIHPRHYGEMAEHHQNAEPHRNRLREGR